MSEKPYWWPDARGWLSIAMFTLTVFVLMLIVLAPDLTKDEFFKVVASAIVVTGLLNNVTGYYFTSSKTNGDLRDQVGKALAVAEAATVASETVQPVEVVNTAADPVPTETVTEADPIFAKPAAEEELPEHAR